MKSILFLFFLLLGIKSNADSCTIKEEYNNVFHQILINAGIPSNEMILKCSSDVLEAEYDSCGGKFCIIFNQEHFDRYSFVVFAGAMCHELGHHVNKHIGSAPSEQSKERERIADEYCGKLMRQLGFSLNDAFEFTMNSSDNPYYYSKDTRHNHIEAGWKSVGGSLIEYVVANPEILWEFRDRALRVYINGREVSFTKYYPAIVYDEKTRSTIELLGYKNRKNARGIGRIVNNRTSICFRRNGDRGYILYDKGNLVPTDDCSVDYGKNLEQNDLLVQCKDDAKSGSYTVYVLKNYRFAPDYFLFPAFTK